MIVFEASEAEYSCSGSSTTKILCQAGLALWEVAVEGVMEEVDDEAEVDGMVTMADCEARVDGEPGADGEAEEAGALGGTGVLNGAGDGAGLGSSGFWS